MNHYDTVPVGGGGDGGAEGPGLVGQTIGAYRVLKELGRGSAGVIHLALADYPGVTTRSDGQGTERRVRIIPERRRTR